MNNTSQKFTEGQPCFDMEYAILSAPVRHTFMMSTIWYLTKDSPNPELQILEIGSWYGGSALSWAQGLKLHNKARGSITCVDAWVPFFDKESNNEDIHLKMEAALESDDAYNIFLHNISTVPKTIECNHIRGQSEDILPTLEEAKYDIIFIDADHAYEPVKRDISNSLALVKDGGIICGDDLNLQFHQCDQENAKQNGHKDFIKDPLTKRNYHPGVTIAVAEIFGEVSSWGGFWAIQKLGDSWQKISLKDMPVDFPDHFPEKAIEDAKQHLADIDIS